MHFDLRFAARSDSPLDAVRSEGCLRKAIRLQNIFMHLPITLAISGLSAAHIDRHLTAGLTGAGVVADASRFGLERPVHRMKNCPQSKPNGALRRIQFDLNRGRKSRIAGRIRTAAEANQQEGQQSERHKRVVGCQWSVVSVGRAIALISIDSLLSHYIPFEGTDLSSVSFSLAPATDTGNCLRNSTPRDSYHGRISRAESMNPTCPP